LGVAKLPQSLHCPEGMVFGGWIALVIHIVQQSRNRPHGLIFAELLSVKAHRRFHRKGVLTQVFALCPLAQELPSGLPVQNGCALWGLRWLCQRDPLIFVLPIENEFGKPADCSFCIKPIATQPGKSGWGKIK